VGLAGGVISGIISGFLALLVQLATEIAGGAGDDGRREWVSPCEAEVLDWRFAWLCWWGRGVKVAVVGSVFVAGEVGWVMGIARVGSNN